jgi:hypothetical protein
MIRHTIQSFGLSLTYHRGCLPLVPHLRNLPRIPSRCCCLPPESANSTGADAVTFRRNVSDFRGNVSDLRRKVYEVEQYTDNHDEPGPCDDLENKADATDTVYPSERGVLESAKNHRKGHDKPRFDQLEAGLGVVVVAFGREDTDWAVSPGNIDQV